MGNAATRISATGHFAGCAGWRGKKQNQVEQLTLTCQEIGFASIAGTIITQLVRYAIEKNANGGVAATAGTVVG